MRNHILQSINHLSHKDVKLVEAMKLNSHVSEQLKSHMLKVGFIKNEEAKLVGTHVSKCFKEMGFQDNESKQLKWTYI